MHRVSLLEQQCLIGKQKEIFVLNANAELTFENLRYLRATMLAPDLYSMSEFIKGKPGQIGSVQYQEFKDHSRSYEIKIVGINERKMTLDLETLDYREPGAHSCTIKEIHDAAHDHEAHSQSKVRLVRIKVQPLTNPLSEDEQGEPCERCLITWTTRISGDSRSLQSHLDSIRDYKKNVIRSLQLGVKDKTLMHRASGKTDDQIIIEEIPTSQGTK